MSLSAREQSIIDAIFGPDERSIRPVYVVTADRHGRLQVNADVALLQVFAPIIGQDVETRVKAVETARRRQEAHR